RHLSLYANCIYDNNFRSIVQAYCLILPLIIGGLFFMLTKKKKAITIIASEETYINLSTFDDIESLNKTVREYKEIHKLNKNQTRVLNLLHRYSAKYKGVSFLTKNNIANQLEISKRTVIRVCQHLESLKIIKQYEMKRK